MQTLSKPLALVALFALGLAQQNPWTSWGIYADSTGNGVTPVHSTLQCPDTFWLVVDTSGMAAAGITSWKWLRGTFTTASVVYPPPSSPFPAAGLSDRKVGVGLPSGPPSGEKTFMLRVYFASGDSASFARSVKIKGGGTLSLTNRSPYNICPNTLVTLKWEVPTDIDSFIVQYGPNNTDTVKNRTTFQVNAPSSPGPWTITAQAYVCGKPLSPTTLNLNVGSGNLFVPPLTVSPTSLCPGSTVTLSADPTLLVGMSNLTIKVLDPSNNILSTQTVTSLPFSWTVPSGATQGSYTLQVIANYPCGSSNPSSTSFYVYGPTSLTAPNLSFSSNYCPGTEATISISSAQGFISIDIGDDGSWEYVGLPSGDFQHTFSTVPSTGVDIKVRQDVGCYNREDVLTWNPSNPNAAPIPNIFFNSFWCPNGTVQLSGFVQYYTAGAPGNYLTWQAPWINGGNPFYGTQIDTILPAPPTSSGGTITVIAHNSCGSSSPFSYTLRSNPPSSSPITVIGTACVSTGGTIGITLPYSKADSVRYYLPNGSIVTLSPQDTLNYSVPPNTETASIVVEEFFGGCATQTRAVPLPISKEPAKVLTSSTGLSTCTNGIIGYSADVSASTQQVRLYQGSTLVATAVPTSIGVSFSVNILITAPSTAGNYTYTLVAIGCGGNDTAQFALQVNSGQAANFTAPATACVGQPVTFQRSGTNQGVLGAQWNFGDGNLRIDTNLIVTHTYTTAGTYFVSLSMKSSCGYTGAQRTIKVYGGPPTLSGFSVTPADPSITYSVSATDYDSVKWVFGDGNSALGLSGSHTYTANGNYTVQAIAYNPCGNDTMSTTVTITAAALPSTWSAGGWQLFPNPAHDAVTLTNSSYTGAVRVQLYDLHGRLVREAQIDAMPGRLSVSGLPAGLYHLRLHTPMGTETLRLLVE